MAQQFGVLEFKVRPRSLHPPLADLHRFRLAHRVHADKQKNGCRQGPWMSHGVGAWYRRRELAGKRVAVILTGGNVTEEQVRQWLY